MMKDSTAAWLLRHRLIHQHGFVTAEGYSYLQINAQHTTFEVTHTDPEQLTLALLSIDTDTLLGVFEVGVSG